MKLMATFPGSNLMFKKNQKFADGATNTTFGTNNFGPKHGLRRLMLNLTTKSVEMLTSAPCTMMICTELNLIFENVYPVDDLTIFLGAQ